MERRTLQIKISFSHLALILVFTSAFGLALNPALTYAQSASVSGIVTSQDDGTTLPGVNVVVKGTVQGTTTDAGGRYTINVPNEDATLVFSFIGYKVAEVVVGGKTTVDVVLASDVQQLSEVVVVGYGTQKRSDITGSVASVPKERLINLPVTNLTHAIQGTTAGLNIVQNSSVPGSSSTMQIRGLNSINANTSPFIVLDGVPFFGQTNDINPNDIESIEILKDASAVAIYGTRGANGVILITTKRGISGKPVISYNGYAGVEEIAHKLNPMRPDAYVQKYADYMTARNLTQTEVLPNTFEVDNYNAGVTTDWLDAATQTGKVQQHNVSIRGGSDNMQYYVAGEYLDQEGVVKGYQYKRISARSNLDVTITNYLKVGTSMFYTNNNHDGGRANLLNATAMSPYSRVYDTDGKYLIHPMSPELLFSNPLLGMTNDRIDRKNNLTGGAYAEVTPGFLKGLKYRLNGSYVLQTNRYANYAGRAANDQSGTAEIANSETSNWVLENLLTYAKDINKHHIDFTALYSAQRTNFFGSNIRSVGFINDELSYNNLGAGTTLSPVTVNDNGTNGTTGSWSKASGLLSQMGRINYSYDGRYLLSVTARRDGYSAFGANSSKYAFFPSFALGWNIHNERFITNTNAVNQLKLRFSYGKVGNQAIGVNQTVTTSRAVLYPFNGSGSIGVLANVLGNQELTWETTRSANLGLDFAFAKNRISGTIEVYRTKSEDLLLERNIPNISGYTKVWDNLGRLQNTGLEFSLKTVNVETGDFKWESNINFSTFRNELLEIYGDGKDDIGNSWFIGHPLQVIYDYELVGIWQEGEETANWDPAAKPGHLKFKDQLTVDTDGDGEPDAADGVINANDRVILGTSLPKWYGGLTNTFRYKNFHLNVFIQTSQGSLKRNRDISYGDEIGRRNVPAEVGYWTPENKSNTWPSLDYTNTRGYGYPEESSYVRIKDVTLSYSVPASLLERAHIKTLTVYVAGRNLYTFTDWIGWDPENDHSPRGSGDWQNNYPLIRTYSLGVNLTL